MTSFRAGFAKTSITVFDPELCMFGWGHPRHIASGVDMPLHARVMALEERASRRRFVYVVCDLGMISESVRQAVSRRVCTHDNQLADHDLMIAATHTHSAPGGFSSYLFYAISIPGVSQRIHDTIVDGIVLAVQRALDALTPARAYLHSGWIPASEPVAFNRAVSAYNRNLDTTPVTPERSDEALERRMTVLRVDREDGEPLGLVSWFAVHGTSVHHEQRRLHGDNKGHAALATEARAREAGHPHFVALFAQESAGDVSPNYRYHAKRELMVGRYDDDHASARFNGEIQARHARVLFESAKSRGEELHGPITTAMRYRDFFDRTADAEFSRASDARTGIPRLGIAFSLGTLEGRGPFFKAHRFFPLFSRLQRLSLKRETSWRSQHGPKFPFWDMGLGRDNKVLGILPAVNPLLYAFSDRFVAYYRKAVTEPGTRDRPWVPRYLPIQQVRIGSLLIAGLPNEPTTVAGRRMRNTLAHAWASEGVRHHVIAAYANAYTSYLTTPEEYEEQGYEGASTLYGQWSLPVFCTELRELAREMRAGDAHASLGEPPPAVDLRGMSTPLPSNPTSAPPVLGS